MSNILSLPLYQIADAVQSNEDWNLTLAFLLNDGVTALDLSEIAFTASFGPYSVAGTISGASNNMLTFYAPASEVSTWDEGVYALTVLSTAVDGTRDLLGYSTMTVGAPQVLPTLKQLVPAGGVVSALVSAVPPGLTAAQLAGLLATLPKSTLAPLASVLLGALPHVANGDAIPAAGLPYADADGFYADSQ